MIQTCDPRDRIVYPIHKLMIATRFVLKLSTKTNSCVHCFVFVVWYTLSFQTVSFLVLVCVLFVFVVVVVVIVVFTENNNRA